MYFLSTVLSFSVSLSLSLSLTHTHHTLSNGGWIKWTAIRYSCLAFICILYCILLLVKPSCGFLHNSLDPESRLRHIYLLGLSKSVSFTKIKIRLISNSLSIRFVWMILFPFLLSCSIIRFEITLPETVKFFLNCFLVHYLE